MATTETEQKTEGKPIQPPQPLPLPTLKNNRKFRVISGRFGPWQASKSGNNPDATDVFSEEQFRNHYPVEMRNSIGGIIPGPDGKAMAATGIDVDTYHADLLDRGIAAGAIIEDPSAVITKSVHGVDINGKNASIRSSTESILRQKAERDAMIPAGAVEMPKTSANEHTTGKTYQLPAAAGSGK